MYSWEILHFSQKYKSKIEERVFEKFDKTSLQQSSTKIDEKGM